MPDDEKRQVQILPTVGVNECFTAYANFGNIIATPFNIQIVFSDLLEDEGSLVPQARARIIMAPEHADLLMRALATRLKAFAESYGGLRKPFVAGPTPGHAVIENTVEVEHTDKPAQ